MKKFLTVVFLSTLFSACSSEPNSPTEVTPVKFEVALEASSLLLDVDETAVVTFQSDSPISEVKWVRENSNRAYSAFDGKALEKDIRLYFQFAYPGTYPVLLEFKDLNGKILQKKLTFEVIPGNAVQITEIEIKSFYDMGNSWDPEAAGEDQLADLIFALEKPHHVGFVEDKLQTTGWFISEVHENESSLSWDLTGQDLYLNPLFGFDFGLGDVDEGGMHQNLMLDRLSYKMELRDKISERPATVSLIDESVNLQVDFHLKWP